MSVTLRKITLPLLAGMAALLAAACGPAKIQYVGDELFPARPADYPITLTKNVFEEPYKEIAILTTGSYPLEIAEDVGAREITLLARRCGADAVIRLRWKGDLRTQFDYDPGVHLTHRGLNIQEEVALTGVAVRFIRPDRGAAQ